MKNLRKFNTTAERDAWLRSDEFASPNIVLTEYLVEYNLISLAHTPLYIEAIEDLTIKFNNIYEYGKDNSTWSSGTRSTSISAKAGEKVYFRTSGLTATSSSGIGTFTISNGKCNVGGNIMSMAYGADFKGQKVITNTHQFFKLFYDCSRIVDASSLVLPATSLKSLCYGYMFSGCNSLVTAPTLPATTLVEYCYGYMFNNCTSLVTAPELPATTLATNCYNNMFRGCTSLTTAPSVLPATTLASDCYAYMFQNCTKLTTAPELPATTLASYCYSRMFFGCTSLTTAPELPATTLTDRCYNNMFNGCSKLNYIKAMFKTTPNSTFTGN